MPTANNPKAQTFIQSCSIKSIVFPLYVIIIYILSAFVKVDHEEKSKDSHNSYKLLPHKRLRHAGGTALHVTPYHIRTYNHTYILSEYPYYLSYLDYFAYQRG